MHGGIFRHRQPKGPAPATARPKHHRATPRLYKVSGDPVFEERGRWRGARREDTRPWSLTDEPRSQMPLSSKTRRAAVPLGVSFVGSAVTARCGDAPTSPPRTPPKPLAAGPHSLLRWALRNPDDPIAYRAAILLGKMAENPALTVPALIESVQSTNKLVASSAASALGSFPQHAELIVPVLLQAYQDTNRVVSRRESGGALKKVAPQIAKSLGIK